MNEDEKAIREWIKKQINDCTILIQAVSDMDSKKEYAKDRTKFKEVLNLIDKQNKVIDLMAKGILNYDNQLVINSFKNKENVKEQYFRKVEEDE